MNEPMTIKRLGVTKSWLLDQNVKPSVDEINEIWDLARQGLELREVEALKKDQNRFNWIFKTLNDDSPLGNLYDELTAARIGRTQACQKVVELQQEISTLRGYSPLAEAIKNSTSPLAERYAKELKEVREAIEHAKLGVDVIIADEYDFGEEFTGVESVYVAKEVAPHLDKALSTLKRWEGKK